MTTKQTRGQANRRTIVSGACASALLLAACTSLPQIDVPAKLRPAANASHAMTVAARGVQIYECRARNDGTGHEWTFVAPEADLVDAYGRRVGTHGAGPSWQARDGSRVVGTLKERADAPAADAIPWLLLDARSVGPDGAFSKVTSIQRVNTSGGKAPPAGCAKDTAGKTARIAYTADYSFFTSK